MGRNKIERLPFFGLDTRFVTYANSADPDQTPQKAAPDQGLHILLKGVSLQSKK